MPRRSPAILPAVALLRGINVGGKNRIAMSDLADVFASAGCGEVRTYIQSGNVLFTASPALLGRVPERVSREIAARFGLRVPVVVRTADELRECVRRNPYLDSGAEAATLMRNNLLQIPFPRRGTPPR